jgi:hypothetical protein
VLHPPRNKSTKLKQRKKTSENREACTAAGIEKMLTKKASRKAKLEVRLSRKLGNELSAQNSDRQIFNFFYCNTFINHEHMFWVAYIL